jgi:hypothetical protein
LRAVAEYAVTGGLTTHGVTQRIRTAAAVIVKLKTVLRAPVAELAVTTGDCTSITVRN